MTPDAEVSSRVQTKPDSPRSNFIIAVPCEIATDTFMFSLCAHARDREKTENCEAITLCYDGKKSFVRKCSRKWIYDIAVFAS